MDNRLLVGAAEVDITPPVGTPMCGNLKPRPSTGIEDALTFKAVVLESGGVTLAYVLADLVALPREVGDKLVALASSRTGIPPRHIVWAASHTHTGPYTWPDHAATDRAWLAGLAEKFAQAVALAHETRRPARMCLERGYSMAHVHNRRLKYKDGREINTWLLHAGEAGVQSLGTAAPIDPEVGILSFDDMDGVPIAILWHYAVHTNANFGSRFSADYPGVVAARLRERFGSGTVPIFMPGAFGDINPVTAEASPDRRAHRMLGDQLANVIVERMDRRKPRLCVATLGALKEEVVVPYRDYTVDQEQRIRDSQWSPENADLFREAVELLRKRGIREARTLVQAWRIGDIGFVSLPGEIFVEWGLRLKAESPFPWTFPVFLGGDCLGYLVTPQAWRAGGYESLINTYSRASVEGVAKMVDVAADCLTRLWKG